MRRLLVPALLLWMACLPATAQASAEHIRQWMAAQQWKQVVAALEPLPKRTAEQEYDYGTALAHLERWQEAEAVLQAGERLAPQDERFPVELAGIAYRQKRYVRATKKLRRALRLKPDDAYANNFLATIYFLEDNLPAALKYWNRVGKPVLAQVRSEPPLRVSPALLDHAFAFSPASELTPRELYDSDARVRGLGIFPQHHFDLRARDDGRFDLVFRAQERNGFGDTKLEALFLLLRGLPFQAVEPEYDNLHGEAVNLRGMVRWDAQKRRVFAEVSGPFEHSAARRFDATLDLRNENWAVRRSFTGTAPVLASLNLRREVGSFAIASHGGDRLEWSAGAELSHRDYRSVEAGSLLTPALLSEGFELKQTARLQSTLLRVPERRFRLTAAASSQAARLWSASPQAFEKLQGRLGWHWLPEATGRDWETRQELRGGKTFGQPPFDELFELGLERDNDLPMRAHIGTRDGRKGSAPLGRNYFMTSWETDRILYANGLMTVTLGPFLDMGKITDPIVGLGSQKWLFDTGGQTELRLFGTTLAFSYGKDLRSGNNAFYLRLLAKGD